MIFGATYQGVYPAISPIANIGSVTLPDVLGIDLWLTITLFVLICVTLFYFLERHGELRKDKLGALALISLDGFEEQHSELRKDEVKVN